MDVVAFRWLAPQQAPDFRSIGRFRARHLAALANVFFQALQHCQAADMVSLGRVALDGTKVRANASRHKAMSDARLTTTQKVLADEISALMEEAKTVDSDEDGRPNPGQHHPDRTHGTKVENQEGQKIYARRKSIVKTVFGQIHTRHGKHVLLHGLEKAARECELLASCHNLLKLHGYRTN